MDAGELGRQSADQADDGPGEARELSRQPYMQDFAAQPMTRREIELRNKDYSRWRRSRYPL